MRFFRRRDRERVDSPPAGDTEPPDDEPGAADDADAGDDAWASAAHEDTDEDALWRDRASAVIPGGASTGSKRPDALYGEAGVGPAHYTRARGCELVTASGLK